MEREQWSGLTTLATKVNSNSIKQTGKESSYMRMETSMMVAGPATKRTDTEFTRTQKARDTRATGRMTNSTEKASNTGLKEPDTKVNTRTA